MAMRRGRTARGAHRSDGFAARHVLSHLHPNLRHVAVAGRDAVAVVNHHNVAVAAVRAGESDSSVGSGLDCGSVIGRNIQPGVVFITFAERIATVTETVSDVSAHGPAARGRSEFDLVPVKNIFDPTQLALQGGGRLLNIPN